MQRSRAIKHCLVSAADGNDDLMMCATTVYQGAVMTYFTKDEFDKVLHAHKESTYVSNVRARAARVGARSMACMTLQNGSKLQVNECPNHVLKSPSH